MRAYANIHQSRWSWPLFHLFPLSLCSRLSDSPPHAISPARSSASDVHIFLSKYRRRSLRWMAPLSSTTARLASRAQSSPSTASFRSSSYAFCCPALCSDPVSSKSRALFFTRMSITELHVSSHVPAVTDMYPDTACASHSYAPWHYIPNAGFPTAYWLALALANSLLYCWRTHLDARSRQMGARRCRAFSRCLIEHAVSDSNTSTCDS